jgi:hypothetical protein
MVRNPPGYFFCFGALPVPLSGTDWNVAEALSKTINDPVAGVVSVGVNVTLILQLFPGASTFSMHFDVTANGGNAVSLMTVTLIWDFFPSMFLIVTFFALLV